MSHKSVCRIADLTEKIGWYVSHPIMDFDTGHLLVGVNTPITLKLIEAIQKRNIEAVQISDEPNELDVVYGEEAMEANERIARESNRRMTKVLTDISKDMRKHKKFSNMKNALTNSALEKIEDVVGKVIELISDNPTSAMYLGMIEDNDPYLIHHSANVTFLTLCLAQHSLAIREIIRDPNKGASRFLVPGNSFNANDLVPLGIAAMLHDVGKVFMLETMAKDSRYEDDNEAWELIKQHSKIGHDILFGKKVDQHALLGVKYHHENFDGSGYPYGISGYKIHVFARILRVVDSFDAATSVRPGRGFPKSPEEICREILLLARKHYDPEIAAYFVAMVLGRELPKKQSGGSK